MNGHVQRCRCENCQVRSLIKILENTQERLLIRVAELEKQVERLTAKPVLDPEFDWGNVDASGICLTPGISPPKTVPPMTTIKLEIEADRTKDEAYFKDRAAGFRTVEIVADESWPDQPFVIGGES